jgi:Zn-dependent peptidase ImmA (M78 family)
MRHKTDDHLWFTLFHECAHVLQAPRRREFLDTAALLDEQGDDDEDERLADEFARNMLIPLRAYEGFVNAGDFTESSIRSFARDLEIGAGLVVGRLQRDRHVSPAHFNQLKKQLSWATER